MRKESNHVNIKEENAQDFERRRIFKSDKMIKKQGTNDSSKSLPKFIKVNKLLTKNT